MAPPELSLNLKCSLGTEQHLGSTSQQGGSVINYVLSDPELSQMYKIRATVM